MRASIVSYCGSSAARRSRRTSPAKCSSTSGGKPTDSRRARRSRPGCWPSPVTRRWPRCGVGTRRRTTEPWGASDPADDPEATFETKHRGEILRNCLTRLSPRHREIIDLVYYDEKSVEEVADILGVPGNPVNTRMFRARKKLSQRLAARGVAGAMS